MARWSQRMSGGYSFIPQMAHGIVLLARYTAAAEFQLSIHVMVARLSGVAALMAQISGCFWRGLSGAAKLFAGQICDAGLSCSAPHLALVRSLLNILIWKLLIDCLSPKWISEGYWHCVRIYFIMNPSAASGGRHGKHCLAKVGGIPARPQWNFVHQLAGLPDLKLTYRCIVV